MTKDHHQAALEQRRRRARVLRRTRKVHRWSGISLFVFFFVMAVTGVLLGWKKHAGSAIIPPTQRGSSTELAEWLPLTQLLDPDSWHLPPGQNIDPTVDRIDVRPGKGIVKVLLKQDNWEVQLDGATGEVLSFGRRHSDWIESWHDGSAVDDLLGIPNGYFKVTYNSVMGLALVVFVVTGFWLWYGPKRM